jgi:trigger factor
MANVTREVLGILHDKVTVKLSKEDYLPNFDKTLKQYAKTANVPGFRKGMVPMGMIRKMAGQSLFNEEVIRTAGKQLEDYMQKERLAIFAQPMILPEESPARLDINNPGDVNFTFEIGIKPDFEITALKDGTKLTAYKINVTDKMLDDEIERIKRRFGKVESQDSVTNKEDIIYCTFEKSDADGNVIKGADKLEETVVFDKIPVKLQEMIMGKIPGSVLVFRPADVCTGEELPKFLKDPLKAGEEAADQHYLMTLTKVGLLIPVELDQELYAKVFPSALIADDSQFRELLKVELQREFDRIGRERFHNEIFELLVHTTKIILPVVFLKRWLKEGGEHIKTAEEVENEFGQFEHQLRWQLISDQVIHENKIVVTKDEVTKDIKARVMAYYGMDVEDEAPWMDSYMEKVMKDNKMADETYRRLLTDKIFLALEAVIPVEFKEIEEEEFFKLPDAHATHHHHHH